MSSQAADLSRRLAREAEAVCRHYLPHGRRQGRYWIAGDVRGAHGRSLYVRLYGPDAGSGAVGKWTDAATGEHGDLLDLIARNRGHTRLADILDEARAFLSLPRATRTGSEPDGNVRSSTEAAQRLFAAARSLVGTPAEAYLRGRGITAPLDWRSLRYHPSVYYRAREGASREAWPALLAAVTDLSGTITGLQRTWLDPVHVSKAPLADPRRAMGRLLGNGVRFGRVLDVVVAGEGIETMLALKSALPTLPMIAGLSANHLAALELPPSLRRLYIARDNDAAGRIGAERFALRAATLGIEVFPLVPRFADFNVDLERLGAGAMLRNVVPQLHPVDRVIPLSGGSPL